MKIGDIYTLAFKDGPFHHITRFYVILSGYLFYDTVCVLSSDGKIYRIRAKFIKEHMILLA